MRGLPRGESAGGVPFLTGAACVCVGKSGGLWYMRVLQHPGSPLQKLVLEAQSSAVFWKLVSGSNFCEQFLVT